MDGLVSIVDEVRREYVVMRCLSRKFHETKPPPPPSDTTAHLVMDDDQYTLGGAPFIDGAPECDHDHRLQRRQRRRGVHGARRGTAAAGTLAAEGFWVLPTRSSAQAVADRTSGYVPDFSPISVVNNTNNAMEEDALAVLPPTTTTTLDDFMKTYEHVCVSHLAWVQPLTLSTARRAEDHAANHRKRKKRLTVQPLAIGQQGLGLPFHHPHRHDQHATTFPLCFVLLPGRPSSLRDPLVVRNRSSG